MSVAADLILMRNTFTPKMLPSLRLWLDAKNEADRRGLSVPTLVDGFNRADGSLGSAPTGQAYSVVSGTWSIASGTARPNDTADAIALFGTTQADGRISLRTQSSGISRYGRIIFRYIDSSNYLIARRNGVDCAITKMDGGVETSLATGGTAGTSSVWTTLEIRYTGNSLTLLVDGVSTVSYTLAGADATKFGSTTGCGLGRGGATTATTIQFDDITVSSGASSMLLPTWSDDSGNGFDFSQATATKQPLGTWFVSPSGVLVPSTRYDGVDDNFVRAAIDVSSSLQGYIYAVIRTAAGAALQAIAGSSDEASTVRTMSMSFRAATGIEADQRNNDVEDEVCENVAVVANTSYLFGVGSTNSAYYLRRNGVSQSKTVLSGADNGNWFGNTSARDSFAIGILKRSTEVTPFSGDIMALLIYDVMPSTVDLLRLDRYFNARYGMGMTL